jgi:hypothetical protein
MSYYMQLHTEEFFLRKMVKKLPVIYETPLPCSQECTTELYLEPDGSNPRPNILFFKITLILLRAATKETYFHSNACNY